MENCSIDVSIWLGFGIDVIIIAVKPKWWVYYFKFLLPNSLISFFIIITFKAVVASKSWSTWKYFVCFYFLLKSFYHVMRYKRNTNILSVVIIAITVTVTVVSRVESNEINSVYRAINLNRGSEKWSPILERFFFCFNFNFCSIPLYSIRFNK